MMTTLLHPYQEGCVDAIIERGSMLVAYDMGLGKTLIALAAVEEWLGDLSATQALLVVPSGLRFQWAGEIARHTDVETTTRSVRVDGVRQDVLVPAESACLIVEGTKAQRVALLHRARVERTEYVIVTYEQVVNDWREMRRLSPEVIVCDEATAIKGFTSKRSKKIKRLTAERRIALTGTPVENGKPEELFSILQWVDPAVLGRADLFDKAYVVRNHFGGVQRYKNLPVLHRKLRPVMQRKTRQDPEVAPFLPAVTHRTESVSMDAATKKAYAAISRDLLVELAETSVAATFDLAAYYSGEGGSDMTARGRIMARMQALDMLLGHPDLLRNSAAAYQRGAGTGSAYAAQVVTSGLLDDLRAAPKLAALVDLVSTITGSPGNKVIVFSVWRGMAEIIAAALPGVSIAYYHGGMSAPEKAAAVARFTEDPTCRVFLSSHAGAYGTNLFAANYLINYDLAFQAGKADQINARHVRASSTFKSVYVIDLVVAASTEVRNAQRLAFKRTVGTAVVDGRGADSKGRVEAAVPSLTEYLQATG